MNIPTDISNIINNYKEELDISEKFKKVLNDIKNIRFYCFEGENYTYDFYLDFICFGNKNKQIVIQSYIYPDGSRIIYNPRTNIQKEFIKYGYGDISNIEEKINKYGKERIIFHKRGMYIAPENEQILYLIEDEDEDNIEEESEIEIEVDSDEEEI